MHRIENSQELEYVALSIKSRFHLDCTFSLNIELILNSNCLSYIVEVINFAYVDTLCNYKMYIIKYYLRNRFFFNSKNCN